MNRVEHFPGFVEGDHETMMNVFDEVTLHAGTITMFGKTFPVPRLTAWIGDPSRSYSFGGKTFFPEPWTPTLSTLRDRLSALEGVEFNSVLVNLYRDGSDSISMHADDEPELGPTSDDIRIASLSLGDARRFRVKGPEVSDAWNLGGGDLLVMRGDLQREHVHGISKTKRKVGPRMNLTFRVIR